MKSKADAGTTQVDQTLLKDRHPELFAFFESYNPEMFIYCLDAKGEPNNFGKLALELVELKKTFSEGKEYALGQGSSVFILGSLSAKAIAITKLNNGSLGLDD
jgi:hypothetical protein